MNVRILLILSLILKLSSAAVFSEPTQPSAPFQDLYDAIMVREGPGGKVYGRDEVSPLFWPSPQRLLKGDVYHKLESALDRFSKLTQDEIEAYSPTRRALLQRQLWELFDQTASLYMDGFEADATIRANRHRIQKLCAELIRRVALTNDQIAALPDPLSATIESGKFPGQFDPDSPLTPFLSASLADEAESWVCLRETSQIIPADFHSELTEWRSAFLVLMRLPKGEKETLDYIHQLAEFKEPWSYNGYSYIPNPETPQFPVGTQVALIERILLINDAGQIVLSPLMLGVQLRAYLSVERRQDSDTLPQALAHFVIRPLELMAGDPMMKAIGPEDFHFSAVMGDTFSKFLKAEEQELKRANGEAAAIVLHGNPRPHLQSCRVCHGPNGIHSVVSRDMYFGPQRALIPAEFLATNPAEIGAATARRKMAHHSWGLLNGLWRSN